MLKVIELYVDQAAEEDVRHLWERLAQAGISNSMPSLGTTPHLSLEVADQLPTAEVIARLQVLTQAIDPPTITLSHLGVFASGVLFLGVNASAALVELHRRVSTAIEPIAQGLNPHYTPEAWVPHCTLALGVAVADLGPAILTCLPDLRPIQATVTAIGVVEVDAEKVTELARREWKYFG